MSSLINEMRKCLKKRRFETERACRREIARAKENYGGTFYYYECKSCGGYHLTKNKSAQGKVL